MTATMKDMELRLADQLFPDQLMENDLIEIEDDFGTEIVSVKNVIAIEQGYAIEVVNDYGEQLEIEFADDALINFYVYIDED